MPDAPIAAGPLDKLVRRLFGLRVPITSSHWQLEFSEAVPGPMFRLCATIYHPTQPPPYNEDTWYSKIAAVVVFRRTVLSARLRRMPPND